MQVEARTEALYGIVHRIQAGERELAEARLHELLRGIDLEADPAALKYFVFGGALSRRLGEGASRAANLYLADFDVPQIDLFNLLARHYTPVALSSRLLNDCIARLVVGRDEATVVDVGIGTGRQISALLDGLRESPRRPRRLTVVGIEPSKWALDLAAGAVRAAGDRAGIAVDFVAFHNVVERLSEAEWGELRRVGRGAVVNASFALHHIADARGTDLRTPVLRRLRALDPAALVLAEPNVDHRESRLARRFHNCWFHFGSVFRLVDTLPIQRQEKDALKVCFFGREIIDILGAAEAERSERHEDVHSWLVRLRDAGFGITDAAARESLPSDPFVHLDVHDGFVGLDWEGSTSIAVMCAVPVATSAASDHGVLETAPPPPGSSHDLGARIYLDAMVAMVRADQIIHDRERAFVDREASLLGVRPESIWSRQAALDEIAVEASRLSPRTREAIVRDAVLLAMVDGHYGDEERALAAELARSLSVDEAFLERAQRALEAYAPDVLRSAPSWFTECWLIAQK